MVFFRNPIGPHLIAYEFTDPDENSEAYTLLLANMRATSDLLFENKPTFQEIRNIFTSFAARLLEATAVPLYNAHLVFNHLHQLYHDILWVELRQFQSNLIHHQVPPQIIPPDSQPTRDPNRTDQASSTTESTNNQVNTLDVPNTPSTTDTSQLSLAVLSAGPIDSPPVALGTSKDIWKGMLKLELPEEEIFPLPTNHGPQLLLFENTYEFHLREYKDLITTQCSYAFLKSQPELMDLFLSQDIIDLFVPKVWTGIKGMPPIKLTFADNLPTKMRPHSRMVSPKLMENAKIKFNRLKQYIYVDSDSHIASPLVIAPKATAPYIRLCGDYREINKYIKCPADAIP